MAGGIANTLKGAKISGIPLTGQDAELAGIQRIIAGTQSSTVYKAFKPEPTPPPSSRSTCSRARTSSPWPPPS